jgi:hypothetical protein
MRGMIEIRAQIFLAIKFDNGDVRKVARVQGVVGTRESNPLADAHATHLRDRRKRILERARELGAIGGGEIGARLKQDNVRDHRARSTLFFVVTSFAWPARPTRRSGSKRLSSKRGFLRKAARFVAKTAGLFAKTTAAFAETAFLTLAGGLRRPRTCGVVVTLKLTTWRSLAFV